MKRHKFTTIVFSDARKLFMVVLGSLLCCLAADCASAQQSQNKQESSEPTNIEAWPFIFELNIGQSCRVERHSEKSTITRTVELLGVKHRMQPDYWCKDNDTHEIFEVAEVSIAVDGVPSTLLARPYQSPIEVNGLRLLVETTQAWALNASYNAMKDVKHAVRFSVVAAGESWGPTNIHFPILSYRWRSSTYYNTWSQIVPYNTLYYHRGEDLGAIPDRLEVVAPWDGTVTKSPPPEGDGGSNGLFIRHADGTVVHFAHMNTEHLTAAAATGNQVTAGTVLGLTGSTWAGRKSQTRDPHLHVGFNRGDMQIDPFPFFTEAYFRDYPDTLIPIAGGYAFTVPGRPIRLDATRSVARPGKQLTNFSWQLQDGQRIESSVAETVYDKPGLYSEMLTVTADDGSVDVDFLQVRVYDPTRGSNIARGWVHMYPGRGLTRGMTALFWNRLTAVENVVIDFGDGSPAVAFGESAEHAYTRSGLHIVTVTGHGPKDEPVTVRLRVIVEAGDE